MDQYYKVLVIPLDGSRMIAKDKFGIECISKCVFKSKISEVKNNVFLTYAWSMFPIDSHCKYQKTFIFVQYSRNLQYSTCNLGIVVELHRTVIRYIMKTPVLIQNFIFTLMTSFRRWFDIKATILTIWAIKKYYSLSNLHFKKVTFFPSPSSLLVVQK